MKTKNFGPVLGLDDETETEFENLVSVWVSLISTPIETKNTPRFGSNFHILEKIQ